MSAPKAETGLPLNVGEGFQKARDPSGLGPNNWSRSSEHELHTWLITSFISLSISPRMVRSTVDGRVSLSQ